MGSFCPILLRTPCLATPGSSILRSRANRNIIFAGHLARASGHSSTNISCSIYHSVRFYFARLAWQRLGRLFYDRVRTETLFLPAIWLAHQGTRRRTYLVVYIILSDSTSHALLGNAWVVYFMIACEQKHYFAGHLARASGHSSTNISCS